MAAADDRQPRPTIGQTLAAFRVRRGLSLSEAADAIGHSVDFLAHIESDLETPSRETLRQLERAYGCSIDEANP